MENIARQGLILELQSAVPFFTVPVLTRSGAVQAAFSTRQGGVSNSPYQSLNLGLHTGDSPEQVIINRRRLGDALGIPLNDWVAAEQVHGDRVASVTADDQGKGSTDYLTAIRGTDALITNKAGVPLIAYFADCVPLMIWDPVQAAIGLVHAGWKGTLLGIGPKTLMEMGRAFGTNPTHCYVTIGPSIGPCCFEVGDEVIRMFSEKYPNLSGLVREEHQARGHLDLWSTNIRSLLATGILPGNITVSGLCTSCHRDMFFSYRSEGGVTGRQAAIIMLN
ncbi:MAG: peptidoglycan editing factor PgeF [Bacillota bacterium]